MLSRRNDYVYERGLLVLAEAAKRLGIHIDLASIASTRRKVGNDTLVPVSEYEAVMRRIFAHPSETLGLDLARALPIERSGLWGFLLHSSPTFGDMMQRAERYIRLAFRYTRVGLRTTDEHVSILCIHPDPSRFGRVEQEVCFFLAQWLTWGRSLVDSDLAPRVAKMRWSGPTRSEPFDEFFGCSVEFDASEDALVFPAEAMKLPLRDSTPELTDVFESYAAALIERMRPESAFAETAREALSQALLTEGASEGAVARRLGLGVRTLRRRLAEFELTFRRLRSEVLQSRAEQLLRESRLPIAEVSYLLGYSEPASFHRAFRRWTGHTPAEWRSLSESLR
jgi:AraC-like DNA-binding protein